MLFLDNSYLKELECKIVNINNNQIILNQTIFYAKSGGQPGDTGTLSNNENDINIIDTTYDVEKNIIHITDENINFEINESNQRFKKIADYRETELDIKFKCECRKNLEQPNEINCKTRNWFQKIWDKINVNAVFFLTK